jgi:hypothetical protein
MGMATDAVEVRLMVVFQIIPAIPVRTLAECHEKNLDIRRHNTQTAWSSTMRESNDPKKKRIKNM